MTLCSLIVIYLFDDTTGCPKVSVSTWTGDSFDIVALWAKSFQPPIEQGAGIFFMYGMPTYTHFYSSCGWKQFLTGLYFLKTSWWANRCCKFPHYIAWVSLPVTLQHSLVCQICKPTGSLWCRKTGEDTSATWRTLCLLCIYRVTQGDLLKTC